ncbi:MAG TPA: hypothetical protein VFB30_09165, partial [Spirochaetia bacterium]|nr:hypothetical protein [Spirochaetia bacterium]
VSTATDEVLAAWESKVDAAFAPELGGLLGPEALAKYDDYKGSLEAGLRREMEKVALQGELSLTARRRYDQYSLRKKSESATADAIADQIVGETQAQTDAGIAQIKSSLALSPDPVDSTVPSIDVQQWLESFKTAFENGLSKWDAAEEKFLTSRMEWERDAGVAYKEGETAWAAAFDRLGTERKAWEQKIETLLQSGKAKWDGEQRELSKAIDDARTELQKECGERLASTQDRVSALVDMYAQSVQVISTAIASGQEVIQKLDIRDGNSNYVKFSKDAVPALTAWQTTTWAGYINNLNTEISNLSSATASSNARIAQYDDDYFKALVMSVWGDKEQAARDMASAKAEKAAEEQNLQSINSRISATVSIRNQMSPVDSSGSIQGDTPLARALQAYESYLKPANPTQADAVQLAWERMSRMGDWLTMLDTYTLSAANARTALENTLGSAFGSQIADLRDVLQTDGDTGVAYLDEYQLELLRAKAVEDYWRQQKAIAEAVVAYAQDASSGRDTADQGRKEYDAAKGAYDARLVEYNAAIVQLQKGGAGLAAARQAIDTAQEAANEDSAAYEEARQKYLDALESSQTGNVDFYRGQIGQKYKELLDASGISGSDSELADATTAYFAAARKHGYDLAVDSAWQSAAVLVKGDPESGFVSLAALKDQANAIRIPPSAIRIPSSIQELGVP